MILVVSSEEKVRKPLGILRRSQTEHRGCRPRQGWCRRPKQNHCTVLGALVSPLRVTVNVNSVVPLLPSALPVTRPSMRFVPIKSAERQGDLMLHRTRDLLMRQRTMLLNAARAHLAEFGIITAQGSHRILDLIREIRIGEVPGWPEIASAALEGLATQLDNLAGEIRRLERRLMAWHRADETSQRFETIPGVGILTATALATSVPDPSVFKSGREFAAFLGLVPRQNSSGGKDRLGRISKMGDGYLRRLLVVGATSVVRRAGGNTSATGAWMRSLLERKPARVVSVAVANKNARIAWAVLTRCETYRAPMAA